MRGGYTEQTEAGVGGDTKSFPAAPSDGVVLTDPSHDRTEKGHPERGYSGGGKFGILTPTPLGYAGRFFHEKVGQATGSISE